jgi:hypothetical protein
MPFTKQHSEVIGDMESFLESFFEDGDIEVQIAFKAESAADGECLAAFIPSPNPTWRLRTA